MSWEGESFRHKLARTLGFAGSKDSQDNTSLSSQPQPKMPVISTLDDKVDYLLGCGYTKPQVKMILAEQHKSADINKSFNRLVSKEAAKYGHGEFMGEQF
jgi:hypothetical protein